MLSNSQEVSLVLLPLRRRYVAETVILVLKSGKQHSKNGDDLYRLQCPSESDLELKKN